MLYIFMRHAVFDKTLTPSQLTLLLTPLLTPFKNHQEKIQSVVQIKFINIMLPEVPRMAGTFLLLLQVQEQI